MATVGRRRRRATTASKPRRRRRVSGTAAVGRTHRRRRVSGTAAVGRTRRRRRSVGATGGSLMKQIVPLAVGMAGGAAAQHFILRPLEKKIAQHAPMAAKFMAVGEIVLGGFVAMKAKNPMMKGVGLGIMAGGVHSGMKQLNLYHESPSVQGVGDYTTVRIPVNGQIRGMLNGIVRDQHGDTYTSLVAGTDEMGSRDTLRNREKFSRTNLLAGLYGIQSGENDAYLDPKGW